MSGTRDSDVSRNTSVWIPITAALAVLLFGFISLLLFWEFGRNPVGLPGLFHYPDATWGDGVLLPLLALFLTILVGKLKKRPRRRWPTWIACAGGAAVGASVAFTWWVDPAPSVNWTTPRPHYFTFAGKWHIGFLIAASALFAGLWVELFRRLRADDSGKAMQLLVSPVIAGAVACGAGYAGLAVADSARAGQTASGRGSLIAVAIAVALLVACLLWAAHGATRAVARTAVAGILAAAAIVAFVDAHAHTGPFMLLCAVAGALGAGVALAGAPGQAGHSKALQMISVPALFAFLTLIALRSTWLPAVILTPAVAIVASIFLRYLYSDQRQRRSAWLSADYLAASGISACLLAAGVFGLWLSNHQSNDYITAGFLLTIIGAVLGGVFLPYFKADFEKLMRIEGDPNLRQPGGQPSPQQRQAARDAWPRLGGYAVSATASMLVLTVALAPSLGWHDGHAHVEWRQPLGIAVIAIILMTPTAHAISEARKQHPDPNHLNAPLGGSKYAWWSFAAGAFVAVTGAVWLLHAASLNPLALLQAVLLAAFTLQNMLGNGAWLHTRRIQPVAQLAVTANALAVFVTTYWSLTEAVRPRGSVSTIGLSFAAFVSAVLFAAILVETTSCATYVAGGQPYNTDYPPIMGISQDTFLMTCMWFILGWMPQTVLAHVPANTPERWSAVGTILAGFLLLFGPAFLWILENNDTHVERQRAARKVRPESGPGNLASATSSTDRIKTLPRRIEGLVRSIRGRSDNLGPDLDDKEFIVRLSGHTAVQNALALILAVTTIIGIIGVSSGLAPTAVGATSPPDIER
jgi:hypothetical protein